MSEIKANIIARLQKDILPLQGFKTTLHNGAVDMDLGSINYAFPNGVFPLGAVHEFLCTGAENIAVTDGFISSIVSSLMRGGRAAIWISSSRTVFPPALRSFGIDPDKIIFVDLQKEKDILWAIEEGLKCDRLAAVVGEIQELGFTASRRLQLSVEQSKVTGFILRHNPRYVATTACVTRWQITPLSTVLENGMPGIGFPRWNVELLKVRNGKPGVWQIEYEAGRFRHVPKNTSIPQEQHRKTG